MEYNFSRVSTRVKANDAIAPITNGVPEFRLIVYEIMVNFFISLTSLKFRS